jgi:DNA replication protein DnaC
MTTEIKQCQECGGIFSFEPLELNGRRLFEPDYCDSCAETLSQQQTKQEQSRVKEASRNAFWDSIPPIYRETDQTKIKATLRNLIANWKGGNAGIIGPSGEGKTRTAVLLLERIHFRRSTMFLSSSNFGKIVASQFSNTPGRRDAAEGIIAKAYHADVLLLDDVGKGRMTDRAEAELHDLLEHRTSWKKTTLWTANSNARQLHAMFTADRADAILRRLTDNTTIITL